MTVNLTLCVVDLVYIAAILWFKDPFIAQYDIFITIVSLVISIVVNQIIMALKVDNYEIRVKYKKLSNSDPLVRSLYNKQGFKEAIEEHTANKNSVINGTLFFMDLDDFKEINDTFGHQVGDIILKCFGKVLGDCFGAENMVGRWGGDEFIAFADGLCDIGAIEKKCAQIETMLRSESLASSNIAVSSSIGVLIIKNTEVDFEVALTIVDKTMYEAKAAGKGQHRLKSYNG